MLGRQLERLRRCTQASEIVVATTRQARDSALIEFCRAQGVRCFRGSEDDVLDRFLGAAEMARADVIVRLTADCPLIDPDIVDRCILRFAETRPDYLSNVLHRTFPRGMDTEVFNRTALERVAALATTPAEREHVTPGFYQNPSMFRLESLQSEVDSSRYRLTVDTGEDFALVEAVYEELYPRNPAFGIEEILALLSRRSDIAELNRYVQQRAATAPSQAVAERHEAPSLDDLPRYSPWPRRLLGLETWEQREKTREEILREYEQEKWAPLLARFREAVTGNLRPRLDDVDGWFSAPPSPEILVTVGERWKLTQWEPARREYLELIHSSVTRWSSHPNALVELGAGYGGVLLHLVRRSYSNTAAIGLDVSASATALLSEIARAEGLRIETGACDLSSPEITSHPIPPRSLVYTSYATSCVPSLGMPFIRQIVAMRPDVVVHVEPFLEHSSESTLLGMLRRRYIAVNGYNRTFLTSLREAANLGLIELLEERPNVFAMNPLFAASIVAWRPR